MRRLHLVVPFLLTVAPSNVSTSAQPVRLDWGSLNLLLLADSSRGTLIWGASPKGAKQSFVAYFEPSEVDVWTQELRQFLALSLTSSDTGTIRATSVLRSKGNGAIYFVRAKWEGQWTDERIIVMQGSTKARQLLIEGTEQNAIEFLEALESVNTQALSMPRTEAVDSTPVLNPVDSGTGPVVQKHPPEVRYPAGERMEGRNGDVWLSYVVTPTGSVDPARIEVLLSDGRAFESSLREALVRTRFTPAHLDGTPINMRVFQHFTFRIIRCKGRELFGGSREFHVAMLCGPPS